MQQDKIEVRALEPAESLNGLGGSGHLFYHPSWLTLLQQHYGYRFWKTTGPGDEYLLVAQVSGVLGQKLVSLPFSDYTIPQVAPERLPLHIEALQRKFPEMPVLLKYAEIYASPDELSFLGVPVSKAYLHRVYIDSNSEMRMAPAFRRGIRKAVKNGLVATLSRSEESLEQFYKLYYRLRTEKLRLIPQPLSFFQQVYDQFIQGGNSFFYEVRQNDELLASAVILREGNILYYKWGCSAQERLYLRPNNLLFSELIKLAYNSGCNFLDLGLSDVDETRGLIRFKNNMGGVPSSIYTYCLYPPGYPLALEKQLKGLVNQVAGMVVQFKLQPGQTQGFSQALYPLFV